MVPAAKDPAPAELASPATNRYHLSGKLYAFLIAFVSAMGGFLFGYDLALIGGANVYLREQFALSDAMFGFTTASTGWAVFSGPSAGRGFVIGWDGGGRCWRPVRCWALVRSSRPSPTA